MKGMSGVLVLLFLACAVPSNGAALSPVTITKSFDPSTISVNGTSLMTVTLTNPNPSPMTSPVFYDTYPLNMLNAVPVSAATTCGGTLDSSGFADFTLYNASIPANGNCTVTFVVTATQVGTYVNTTGPFYGNPPTLNGASATLTVVATPLTKTFTPGQIVAGGQSTLTITLGNTSGASVTNVSFNDNYPVNLVNTATPNASTNCLGGTLTAAANGTSVVLMNTTVPAGGCTTTVSVAGVTPGSYENRVLLGPSPANFVPSATATLIVTAIPTPTLSAWGLILLGGAIAGIGWRLLR
jgi:hypothetical protein